MNVERAQVWHDDVPRSGAEQMAIDQWLAERAAAADTVACRVWHWDRDTLSFGANERARGTWDREALERDELGVVRRPTGGRAVWHAGNDLSYTVTAPLDGRHDLRTIYREIHLRLARAILALGVDAWLAPDLSKPTLDPGACFDLTVGGEVIVHGRKAIGSAQAVIQRPGGRRALLQHGAIARADRAPLLARFRLDSPGGASDIAPTDLPGPRRLAGAIVAEWLADGARPADPQLIGDVIAGHAAMAAKFRDPAWTWRR